MSFKNEILFDIGLGQPQIDFCVRTSDSSLLSILRNCAGRPTFSTEAGKAILAAHPHRVVTSRLGRIEVYQKIGGPETGGKSPEGPHTHVLPQLLASGRTHSANTPISEGLVPCAFLYPASPLRTASGDEKPFDIAQFTAFQGYLERYGVPDYVRTKKEIFDAIKLSAHPVSFLEPETRLKRTALRIAVRQMAQLGKIQGDPQWSQAVLEWLARFDC